MKALIVLATILAVQPALSADRVDSVRHQTSPSILLVPDYEHELFDGSGFDVLHTRDSDRFRSTRTRIGALVDYKSAYDFIALGGGGTRYEQDAWSADRYTLNSVIRKQERATGAGLLANLGVSTVGDHQKGIGEATWNIRLSPSGGFEFIGQREFVETRPSLESGVMTNYLAASGDLAVTDRFTVIGLAGEQWFSDDNRRTHLRGTAIYSLLPEQGLSVQGRARGYESSRSGGVLYFNPDDYERGDIGLRLRRAFGNWRVLAAAGGGRERINRDVEKPTRYADFRAERSFANNFSVALTFSLSKASDSDGAITGGSTYTWRYYRAVLIAPF